MAAAIPSLVGAAVGAIGNHQKQVQYNRDKELAARMESNSPWTNIHGEMPKAPSSVMGDMMQGGAAGLSMGQNIGKAGGLGGFLGGGAQQAGGAVASPNLWAGQDVPKPSLFSGGKSSFSMLG